MDFRRYTIPIPILVVPVIVLVIVIVPVLITIVVVTMMIIVPVPVLATIVELMMMISAKVPNVHNDDNSVFNNSIIQNNKRKRSHTIRMLCLMAMMVLIIMPHGMAKGKDVIRSFF